VTKLFHAFGKFNKQNLFVVQINHTHLGKKAKDWCLQ